MNLIGIVIYNPQIKNLTNKINFLITKYDIIIVDNSEVDNSNFFDGFKLYYRKLKSNYGVAGGARVICKYALIKKYSTITFFDQDTGFEFDNLIKTLDFFENSNFEICYANYSLNKKFVEEFSLSKTGIFSGTILKTTLFNKIGSYRSDFFMEGFDLEFSLRCYVNNIKAFKYKHWFINQTFGSGKIINLFNRKIPVDNHLPWRYFYRGRSLKKILLKYYLNSKSFSIIFKITFAHTKMLIKVILFEELKLDKIKNYFFGLTFKNLYNE